MTLDTQRTAEQVPEREGIKAYCHVCGETLTKLGVCPKATWLPHIAMERAKPEPAGIRGPRSIEK